MICKELVLVSFWLLLLVKLLSCLIALGIVVGWLFVLFIGASYVIDVNGNYDSESLIRQAVAIGVSGAFMIFLFVSGHKMWNFERDRELIEQHKKARVERRVLEEKSKTELERFIGTIRMPQGEQSIKLFRTPNSGSFNVIKMILSLACCIVSVFIIFI